MLVCLTCRNSAKYTTGFGENENEITDEMMQMKQKWMCGFGKGRKEAAQKAWFWWECIYDMALQDDHWAHSIDNEHITKPYRYTDYMLMIRFININVNLMHTNDNTFPWLVFFFFKFIVVSFFFWLHRLGEVAVNLRRRCWIWSWSTHEKSKAESKNGK